jgi:hypothetical protein
VKTFRGRPRGPDLEAREARKAIAIARAMRGEGAACPCCGVIATEHNGEIGSEWITYLCTNAGCEEHGFCFDGVFP